MDRNMTFREMNLKVFRKEPVPHVLFQPRFESWYHWQKKFAGFPPEHDAMSLAELYDELQVSQRYTHHETGIPSPLISHRSPEVKVREKTEEREMMRTYETPHGDLVESFRLTVDDVWREVDFPVKQPEDLKKLRWLLQRTTYSFSAERFEQGDKYLGDRGEPQFWLPKSPYQALAQQWMKLEDFIYALADCPDEVEETMKAIDDTYDGLYEEIVAAGIVKIANFGENIHDQLISPRYFEQYLIPWYEKRSGQLRKAGIYTHNHIDGYFRSLLKYLKDLPFDGLEALTPLPQGDVSLEEMKEHIGDKILLDGIPAVFFLTTYSCEQVMETVERIVELFHPRLVLGASDEVPQGADAEGAIKKLQMVSKWCLAYVNNHEH